MYHLAGPGNRNQHVLLHMPTHRASDLQLQPSHCLLPLLPHLSSVGCLVNSYSGRNGLSDSPCQVNPLLILKESGV